MKFATITMDRGDRKPFMDFCEQQILRFEVRPDKVYFIDHPPTSNQVDLIPRVKEGIQQAKADGYDLVFILESDDFYDATYFNHIPNADFIGEANSIYYNLRNKTYQNFNHPGRSSLFTTGFKISALEGFKWPKNEERFLDIALWKYANESKKSIAWRETGAIGIKHNLGLTAGKGHQMYLKNSDKDHSWLAEHVDEEALTFYKSLKL
jgi:hypothetical protein